MANPTGSTYLQANTGYVWTDGDIYEIVQSDSNEGGTPGITSGAGAASFSGLGVVNQPHQVLLNKIQYTHTHQLADEVSIASLLTFQALFTSSLGTSGWLKVGLRDVNKGQVDGIIQWGVIDYGTAGGGFGGASGLLGPYNFPIAFPNACYLFLPVTITMQSATENISPLGPNSYDWGGFATIKVPSGHRPTKSQFWVYDDTISLISQYLKGARGFYWVAFGY
jgi:hypothetical protein